MSRKFKGTTIQLGAPERLLPTESTGIDLREARSMNRPTRDFEDRPPRRSEREADEAPRRTFSRKTEESGSGRAGDSDEDWRTGPVRRVESTEVPERRSRRPVEDREEAAADKEEDWRAGAGSSSGWPSAFGDRRSSRREEEDTGPRRFSSRADNEDWRRPVPGGAGEREESTRIDRTKSTRPPILAAAATRADEEDDWRTTKPTSSSTTPWARRRQTEEPSTESTTPPKNAAIVSSRRQNKPAVTPSTVQPKGWSSSEDEEAEKEPIVKPDMEKISKFASKIDQLAQLSSNEDVSKKIDSLLKKVPVNFAKAELVSLEPMLAVIRVVLNQDTLCKDDSTVEGLIRFVAPVLICLEDQYVSFGESVLEFQMNIVEETQRFVASIGCPRLSPQTALVEQLWLSLYESGAVCEEIFNLWLENDSFESPNKSTTLFQTEAFRAWIYHKELPGVAASMQRPSHQVSQNEEKDEWESSDDSDIEALVPKRVSGAPLRLGAVAPLKR